MTIILVMPMMITNYYYDGNDGVDGDGMNMMMMMVRIQNDDGGNHQHHCN